MKKGSDEIAPRITDKDVIEHLAAESLYLRHIAPAIPEFTSQSRSRVQRRGQQKKRPRKAALGSVSAGASR